MANIDEPSIIMLDVSRKTIEDRGVEASHEDDWNESQKSKVGFNQLPSVCALLSIKFD
jgi:hypothetical protein